ncbi:MAG: DUF3179 domain-containing protein [Eudoraea sp.]|nr:DUF3179 domain-containing protein [Eudoraea sp.]
MKKIVTFIICAMLCQFSCSSSSTQDQNTDPDNENPSEPSIWSIPIADIFDGGPGRDGIPALENPGFVSVEDEFALLDGDLILGYKNGDDIRAYQHIVLDWHEIVNDNVGDVSIAVTYCPLTGTGIGWNRVIKGKETTFGVSGLLYNTNLIPFDRETKSNWAQILNESVNGELIGEKAELISLVETDWKTWRTMYPTTKALSLNTGFSRTYGVYPYVDYKTNNDFFLFPVPKDNRLPLKERILAVIDETDARAYRFTDLVSENLVRETFKGKEYLVVGNGNFMISFELDANSEGLQFNYVFNGSEIVLRDNENNEWNIFGEAVSGPRFGQRLKSANAFMGYWFSIPAFYTTEIYNN